MTKEFELIESFKLREKHIDKVEVLNKVRFLEVLPKINLATTKQVADFYEVDIQAIYSLVHDHKAELASDGYKTFSSKVVIGELNTVLPSEEVVLVSKEKGGYLIDGKHKIGYSNISLFTKKSILRVGMLLRDSPVAKEVRTMLINAFVDGQSPYVDKNPKIYTEEDNMLLSIINGATKEERALALGEYKRFKDEETKNVGKHLTLVENQFSALVKNLGKLVDANRDNLYLLNEQK